MSAEGLVLEMRGITKEFPGILANDHVDFQLARGEVHALLGENGAGKSTLMNILSGAFSDYGGEILIDGEPAFLRTPREAQHRGIAMIHQELLLVPELSIADNIFLGRELRTRWGTRDRSRMERERCTTDSRPPRLSGRNGLGTDRQPTRGLGSA